MCWPTTFYGLNHSQRRAQPFWNIVRQLSQHLDISSLLRRFNIDIRPLTHVHLHAAKRFRRDYGLMANDSLLVGFMITERISHLVSNDGDFSRIPEITLWTP